MTDGNETAQVRVGVFNASIPVAPGAAARQPVSWHPNLWRDIDTVAGRAELLTEMNRRFPSVIRRQDLWHLGAEINEETAPLAYLAVMAWGLGTNVRYGRSQVVEGLRRRDERRLLVSAAQADAGLAALWCAHYGETKPPPYLGRVPFGTKWLHAAGWLTTAAGEAKPLIFDQYVHNTLVNCLGASMVYPKVATRRSFAAWQVWCEEAATASSIEVSVSAADVELAVFRHSRDDRCPRSLGEAAPCLWAPTQDAR